MSKARRKEERIFLKAFEPILTRPVTHIVAGMVILWVDMVTGRDLMFPILFVIPVVLSGWFCGARLTYALAVSLPVSRFIIASFYEDFGSVLSNVINALVRIAVLGFLGVLVARNARQSREIKVLQGLLPLCMFCKRIRGESQQWEQLEAYISAHSEAQFSHGLCVECAQKHYGDVLDARFLEIGQSDDQGGASRHGASVSETCCCRETEQELATSSHS